MIIDKLQEVHITGEFRRYRYRNPDSGFSVFEVKVLDNKILYDREPFKPGYTVIAAGEIPAEFIENQKLNIKGQWYKHLRYGYQIKIRNIMVLDPETPDGILKFLSSGLIKGIGPAIAERIVKKFGRNTFRIFDNNPDRLLEIKGIGRKNIEYIKENWRKHRQNAELITMLCGYGITLKRAVKVIKHFGDDAVRKVKENPYVLVQVNGIGFKKADEIARNMGYSFTSSERIKAGIVYTLQEATYTEGHCYLPVPELIQRAGEILQVEATLIEEVLFEGTQKTGYLFENYENRGYNLMAEQHKQDSPVFISGGIVIVNNKAYLKNIYRAEKYIIEKFTRMAYQVVEYPEEKKKKIEEVLWEYSGFLTDRQREAVIKALTYKLFVLTGGPGTGKTTTVKALVDVLNIISKKFTLAAPTGKAAKRLSDQTEYPAGTIHRLLQYQHDGTFYYNEDNPLPYDFIIVDEVSMVDVPLMYQLLKAVSEDSSLILIGDADQLPSVGPGNVLRDLLKNEVCASVRLTEIHRQAGESSIIKAAHLINKGIYIKKWLDMPDLEFIPVSDPEMARDIIVDTVCDDKDFSPEDIQVLAPMKKGPIGVTELNLTLQRKLSEYMYNYVVARFNIRSGNANSRKIRFKVGDKVIQLENNYKKGVFNGEQGYITGIEEDEGKVYVAYDDFEIEYDISELDQIGLAYALTVHKSQGSEFPCVVMPVHTQHYVMLYRNLLYTGVTRAKEKLILVGTPKALYIAIKNNRPVKRYTW